MCFFNNCGCNRGCNNNCGCGGTTRYIVGPMGPQGPAGTMTNLNATIFNGAEQALTSGTPLALPTTLTNTGFTVAANSVTVPTTGTYLVSYGVNTAEDAAAGDYVVLANNGVNIPATQREINATTGTGGTYVLNLTAGSVLTLVPVVTGATTLNNTGGPSANLTISRIA